MWFLYSVWLIPFVLTLLAWRAGLHAIVSAGVSKSNVRARTWPAMLFLAGPTAAVMIHIWLRVGHVDSVPAFVWNVAIGAMSSVAALVASTWAPRGFRPLALCASAGWVACFAYVVRGISALGALR